MNLYSYLKENYGEDNPIIINELNIDNMTKNNIRQNIYLLEKDKKVVRYAQGIYYIPKQTIIGLSKLSIEKVIEKKYLQNNNEVFGYYTGLYLKNQLGITTQVPNVFEIISNKESSKKRMIEMRGRKIILRKSNITIDKENVLSLQFFDLFKYLDFDEVISNIDRLVDYIKSNHLTKDMVKQYLYLYPKKTIDLIIRSGLIYEFA